MRAGGRAGCLFFFSLFDEIFRRIVCIGSVLFIVVLCESFASMLCIAGGDGRAVGYVVSLLLCCLAG